MGVLPLFQYHTRYMFVKHEHVPGEGHGHRSKIFCMSGKPLSQGTHMPNMKALSERVQNL